MHNKPEGNVWRTGSQPRGTYDIGSSSPSCTVHSVDNDNKECKMIQMDSRLLKLFANFVHFVLILIIIIRPLTESICRYSFFRGRKGKGGSWQTKTRQNIQNVPKHTQPNPIKNLPLKKFKNTTVVLQWSSLHHVEHDFIWFSLAVGLP